MKKKNIVIVALKESENLGIGYLASVVNEAGYNTRIFVYRDNDEEILAVLKEEDPAIVGFSVVYQYYIDKFVSLVKFLRKEGISAHFTAGGHYPSLKYKELLGFTDSLDSIVRFEGEYTFLELADCISSGEEWRQIKGVAYKCGANIITNTLRPFEKDLDKFPFPVRPTLREYAFGKKYATIIAGRGCIHSCSFCNLREFYRKSKGPVKRTRNPEMVVNEMEYLHKEKQCSIFLFEDDDFPVKSSKGSEWIVRFCSELSIKGLSNKILWKINCRADEVDEDLFSLMKSNGLYMVFIGIDDGTDDGLKNLNKHITVEKNLQGIKILKKLGIGFDYGFMLFQPITTFRTLNNNLDFLQQLCNDGYNTAMFNKLRPYYNTAVEKELSDSGRLKGTPGYFDYDFLEDQMNHYYNFVTDCFMDWLRDPEGLVNLSRWARIYCLVFNRFFRITDEVLRTEQEIKDIIAESNHFILDSMNELSALFESGQYIFDKNLLKNIRTNIHSKHSNFVKRINKSTGNLYRIHNFQIFEPLIKVLQNYG
jgi:anaerobic magnesium-protoporphyrin IX monomethyl ester cyclase